MTATIPPRAAYAVYNRRPVPDAKGSNGAQVLSNWLGIELLAVQRAIPVRFTKTVTANYTLLLTDDVVLVDATSGAITITWPDPTRAQHFTCTVKKIDSSSHAVTFASTIAATSTAATFDGVTSPTLVSQWDSKTERSNGLEYYQKDAGVTAIFTGSVPAANVTSGTFGSASGDTNRYKFAQSGLTIGASNFATGAAAVYETLASLVIVGDTNTGFTGNIRGVNTANSFNITGGRINGTAASPTAIVSDNTLCLVGGQGYDGTTFNVGGSRINFNATQNWNSTSHGAQLTLQTVPNGSTTLTTALTLDQDQSATFAGAGSFTGLLTAAGAIKVTGAPGSFAGGLIYKDTTDGLILSGITGATYDFALLTPAAVGIMMVPTGTSNVTFAAGLAVTGDFSVATSKFTVASASGNTVVAGTSKLTGNVGIGGVSTSTSPLNITGLPTSAAGLNTGDLYTLAGTLHIA